MKRRTGPESWPRRPKSSSPNGGERSKVESWRLHVLMEAGYPLPLAERLAGSEADLHTRGRARRPGLRARDRRRDPALAPAHFRLPRAWHADRDGEGRGDSVRRPQGLLRRVLQPRRRRVAPAAADGLGRGRGHGAAAQRPLAVGLLHAQGSERRRVPRRHDRARPLRRAAPRPRRRRARPRLRPAGAVRGAWRLPSARALDRALRARRPSRRARAAEDRSSPRRACSSASVRCRCCRARSASSPETTPLRSGTCSTTITARFPAARIVVAETYVQGPLAAGAMIDALRRVCAVPGVDVIVLARGGGSFEDLLPFSDEALVRARRRVHRFPSYPPSDTSRTRRCAISLPTRARRRRPRRPGSSSPMRTELLARARARPRRPRTWRARRCSNARRQRLVHVARAAAPRTGARGRAQARAPRARGGPAARAVAARDTRPRLRDRSSRRRDRPFRATSVSAGDPLDVEVADGRFGARVE